MTCTYPVPCLTEKCPECGHFEWKQIDADWEDGQSEKKWMSFRCQGRKFITTHFKRHGVHDGYWIKCELVVRLPIDEATRVSTEVEGEL